MIENHSPTKPAGGERPAFLSSNDVAEITGNPPWAWAFGEGAGAGNGRYFIPCVQADWSSGWGFREVSRRRYYYPEGLGEDLKRFIADVKAQTSDTRFNDAAYLAAKWVVWDARNMGSDDKKPMSFLSVGIVDADPGDIEYRYTVVCDGKPTITHEAA